MRFYTKIDTGRKEIVSLRATRCSNFVISGATKWKGKENPANPLGTRDENISLWHLNDDGPKHRYEEITSFISERAARYLYFDEEQQQLYCGQRGTAKELKAMVEKWDLKLFLEGVSSKEGKCI
jgi:hypothetical protein